MNQTDDGAASAGGTGPTPGPGGRRRPDESMSLLRDVLDNPLDAGYTQWAARADSGAPAPAQPWWRRGIVVLACAVIGAAAIWSARALRPADEVVTNAYGLLVDEIDQRRAEGDALRQDNDVTAAEIEQLQETALAGQAESVLERGRVLGVASGQTRVRGEGLVIELADSRAAQEGTPGTEDERVQDVDLQVLVNALWASGAEAIAIDGQRLGSTSAIRAAGQTILVNLAPVVSPYVVEVIGDPVDLQTKLSRTAAANHLSVLRTTYDITVSMRPAEDLDLGGNPSRTLRFAEPLDGEAPGAPEGTGTAPPGPGVPGSGQDRAGTTDGEVS
ncbi:DUF881 domain-containing protein [Georgenia yuyongxinii]|uniref:DUF881 domain-containing protein n=1 Tax=Georgenia yuyongxinii TaxID=2589797 RepID=A0A552WLG4_9MICO|nr:DUF881 domain-containing protein [Georgenia yuyongxinii]TRW43323.1 DUF881 domain-containing protein [Georgenia yuyongxinii]